jgi:hypothetical protein
MTHDDWKTIQVDVAEGITERECKARRVPCWVKDANDPETEVFAEEAQDIFNEAYDEVEGVMEEVIGSPTDKFRRGFGEMAVSATQRKRLVRELSAMAGFQVRKIVGDLE